MQIPSDSAAAPGGQMKGRILLVDDDAELRRGFARILSGVGYTVQMASNGQEALAFLQGSIYDAIISDISMPGLDGIQFLRAVRQRDLDIPIVLVTAEPTVETAVRAVEHGALRYLVKPVATEILEEAVANAVRLHSLARLKREAIEQLGTTDKQVGDRAGLEASFERALSSLWMAYQPIVNWHQKKIFAYEALARTRESTMLNPNALLSAAERLHRMKEVGRVIRQCVAETMTRSPDVENVFVNLHTLDLADEALFALSAPLSEISARVVLEITERAALDEVDSIPTRIAQLREMGYRIAVDDLGAGYAGLTSFAQLAPDVVKFDMSLVRDVDKKKLKQKLIGSMAALCREMGMLVVAEGVETVAERDVLVDLGIELFQGYLFAKPGEPFPQVNWKA